MAARKSDRQPADSMVTLVFTGAAGGTLYTWQGKILARGESIRLPLPLSEHWRALLASKDAEIR